MKAVTSAQMRAIEQASVAAGVSLDALMENAGAAVARVAGELIGGAWGKQVTVLVGPGNNGGDGLVAARHLSRRGATVTVFLCTKRPSEDPKRSPAEEAGVSVVEIGTGDGDGNLAHALKNTDLIIDAVLGTGRARPIEPPLADFLFNALESAAPVVAIDVPTGLDADSGRFDSHGLPADVTLMLGFPKLGAVARAGDAVCGEMRVLDIGLPSGLDGDVLTEWMDDALAIALLPERAPDANKGSFGKTLIVGGSPNYLGAAVLATRAAVRSGVGLVFLAARESVYRLIAGKVEEAIYHSLPEDKDGEVDGTRAVRSVMELAAGADSLLIGPGLGQASGTVQFMGSLARSLEADTPVVLDADALNILARTHSWWKSCTAPKIITPHPGEMSRLLDIPVSEVQDDRVGTALAAAERFDATVVLKGAATVVARPDGRVRISPWVNAGLAKGGTGDVLAGLLAGLLAQMPESPFDAASLAVYVHGLAGNLARASTGEVGMTAGDVAGHIPAAFLSLQS